MDNARRIHAAVFGLVVVASLAASTWRYPQTSDGGAVLATARSLWSHGTLAIDASFTRDNGYAPSAKAGVDGRAYAKYGIGAAVWLVPWLAVSDAASSATNAAPGRVEPIVLSFVNPLLTGLAAATVAALAMLLGATPGRALALGVAYGVATLAWAYAGTDHTEALQAWLVASASWALASFERAPRARAALLMGILLAAGLLVKPTLAVLAPAFAVGGFVAAHPLRRRHAAWIPVLFGIGIPLAAAVAALMGLNWARFGSPFATAYNEPVMTNPITTGLYGYLLSINKGLPWYAPVVIVAPLGLWRLRRVAPGTVTAIALGAVLWFATNARFYDWGGGWCWGPRYLMPIVPGLVAACAPILASRPGRAVVATLGAAGLAVTLLGVVISEEAYRCTMWQVWLLDEAGTVPAGSAHRPGEIVAYPRPLVDVLPEFSSIPAHWWLARVAAKGCDCAQGSLECSCRGGAMEDDPTFASPPWIGRYPEARPQPSWGVSFIQPAVARRAYRALVFDPRRAPAQAPVP
jgi:MFS family permease